MKPSSISMVSIHRTEVKSIKNLIKIRLKTKNSFKFRKNSLAICSYCGRLPRLSATKQNFSSSKPRNGSPLDRCKYIYNADK